MCVAQRRASSRRIVHFGVASVLALAASAAPPVASAIPYTSEVGHDFAAMVKGPPGACTKNVTMVPGSLRHLTGPQLWKSDSTKFYVARLQPGPDWVGDGGCVISFEGSKQFTNYLSDFRATLASEHLAGPGCNSSSPCRVHKGFHHSWKAVEDKTLAALAEIGCRPDVGAGETKALFVTGHSMGAAVGTLAMYLLQQKGFEIRLAVTFESPRMGNRAFAAAFDEVFTNTPVFRVTNSRDPAIHVPMEGLLGYRHVSTEVFYPSGSTGDFVECPVPEDPGCSGQYNIFGTMFFGKYHCEIPVAPGGEICTVCTLPAEIIV